MQKKYLLFFLASLLILAVFWIKKGAGVKPTQTVSNAAPASTATAKYAFPLTDYFSRIKIRKFGQYFGPNDPKPKMECGRVFVGFHTGDDLETLESEQDADVPVHAITTGKIAQVGQVGGYGGLLIQSTQLVGEPVTIYYGHIDLESVSKKVGDKVKSGEQIAVLGQTCSDETDGERKHLHFAIKKGNVIDVRGYVPSADVLVSWENPGELLKKLPSF